MTIFGWLLYPPIKRWPSKAKAPPFSLFCNAYHFPPSIKKNQRKREQSRQLLKEMAATVMATETHHCHRPFFAATFILLFLPLPSLPPLPSPPPPFLMLPLLVDCCLCNTLTMVVVY
jgi:hypothetical protein